MAKVESLPGRYLTLEMRASGGYTSPRTLLHGATERDMVNEKFIMAEVDKHTWALDDIASDIQRIGQTTTRSMDDSIEYAKWQLRTMMRDVNVLDRVPGAQEFKLHFRERARRLEGWLNSPKESNGNLKPLVQPEDGFDRKGAKDLLVKELKDARNLISSNQEFISGIKSQLNNPGFSSKRLKPLIKVMGTRGKSNFYIRLHWAGCLHEGG